MAMLASLDQAEADQPPGQYYEDVESSRIWLAKAWRDLWQHWRLALGTGACVALIGYLLLRGLEQIGLGSLILPLASGFLLTAPLAAVPLYEASRLGEAGRPITINALRTLWQRSGDQILLMGAILVMLELVWLLLAFVLFALFFAGAPPGLDNWLVTLLTPPGHPVFLLLGTAVGGALAVIAFAISAFSLPLLVDRTISVTDAIQTSVALTLQHRQSMIGWAATIAVLTGAGLLLGFVGLIITFPLVSFASWHAYCGLCRTTAGQ